MIICSFWTTLSVYLRIVLKESRFHYMLTYLSSPSSQKRFFCFPLLCYWLCFQTMPLDLFNNEKLVIWNYPKVRRDGSELLCWSSEHESRNSNSSGNKVVKVNIVNCLEEWHHSESTLRETSISRTLQEFLQKDHSLLLHIFPFWEALTADTCIRLAFILSWMRCSTFLVHSWCGQTRNIRPANNFWLSRFWARC